MIKLFRNFIEGIVQEGFDWLRLLRKLSFLVLIVLSIWFIYPYVKSVIYHAQNRGDVEFRLLALEQKCDYLSKEINKFKRRIKKLE
ncbi:MAG: hypothetical protein U9O55_02415 [Patescibacteria group bacterium]|nr:hypothetical protein [Patescibacteria group bacterium]